MPMDLFEIRNALANGRSIFDLDLRVTYYARVSTDKDEQLHSLKAQVDYYREYIQSNPGWTYTEGYIDEGISGTSVEKRESFLQMIEDAKSGKFDFIITKEISRFSRNTVDSIQYTQRLLSYGVGVYFQSDNINTLLPDSELRLTILSSIAQEEVRKLSERVKFGFRRAIDKGTVLGNSSIWGYTKSGGRLVIAEEEAEIVRKIFEMYAAEGKGIRAISACLAENGFRNKNGNPFSFSTIRSILSNPKYKGYYCGGKTRKTDYKLKEIKHILESDWVIYKDESGETVPAIVSEELWEKANLLLKKRSSAMSAENKTSYQNKYKYSGKIICAEHHLPFHRSCYRYKQSTKEVWQCKAYAEKGRKGCSCPPVYTDELDKTMRLVAGFLIKNKSEIIHTMLSVYGKIKNSPESGADIAKLESKLEALLRRKDRILDLNIDGKISDDEFRKRNDRYSLETEDCRRKIAEFRQARIHSGNFTDSAGILGDAIAKELDFRDGMDNSLVDRLIDRIEVYHTGNRQLYIKVYVKTAGNRTFTFSVTRNRGKDSSVCSVQSILCGQI